MDRVRGQEQRVNISFVCREYEGKGVAQAGRCGPHESARCSSVVNLPVTWLPESSTGSAREWEIGGGARADVNARARGPWRPHARPLQSKNQESFAFICMDWNWNKTVQEGRKRLLRAGETTAETIPGCRADRRAGGHVDAERLN